MSTESRRKRPLLATGNEEEWAKINAEETEHHRRAALSLTPAERIAQGQKLSQQAVALLGAAIKDGRVPRRAYWS